VDGAGRNVVEQSVVHAQRHYLESWRAGVDAETSGADNLRTLELVHAAYTVHPVAGRA
jgi:hypothetical protein